MSARTLIALLSVALVSSLLGMAWAQDLDKQGAASSAGQWVVAAIGDSLTDPRSQGGKYLNYVKRRCPSMQVDNYGRGGENVAQMRRRFSRDVLGIPFDPQRPKPRYSHVIVFGGVNDVCGDISAGRSLAKIQADLSAMYVAAREHSSKVVAFTLSPWGGFTTYYNPRRGAATLALNDWIKAQRDAGAIDYVVDVYPLLSCGDSEKLCKYFMRPGDGLHFNEEGHARVGEVLLREVFAGCK